MTANIKFKTMDLTLTRTIPASPEEVFDGWLDATNPGTPWSMGKKLILAKSPKPDDLFYFLTSKDEPVPHFGRFVAIERPARVQYTWMSPYTRGLESVVTVTFRKKGDDTLLTLNHTGLPDDEYGRAHDGGWTYFLGVIEERFSKVRA